MIVKKTNQEMKDYMMKFGGSLNSQIIGMFIELQSEIDALKTHTATSKDSKPVPSSKGKGKV